VSIITSDQIHYVDEVIKHAKNPENIHGVTSLCLTGADLNVMDGVTWQYLVKVYQEVVFSRTSPEQKLFIVEQYQQRGPCTGMFSFRIVSMAEYAYT
jgi:sodium/potassium-transporting ATPase subunit alpha